MRLPDWDTVWRTLLLLLLVSAFVVFIFWRAFFDNPALDPVRIGQTTEAKP